MFVAIKIFEISLNNLILKPKQELIVGFKVKKKCYVHSFFTTPSQQSINDKLLLVVMSGQNSNLSYIFKWEPKTTYHLYFYCETFERILITSKQWTKVFFLVSHSGLYIKAEGLKWTLWPGSNKIFIYKIFKIFFILTS